MLSVLQMWGLAFALDNTAQYVVDHLGNKDTLVSSIQLPTGPLCQFLQSCLPSLAVFSLMWLEMDLGKNFSGTEVRLAGSDIVGSDICLFI